MAEEGQWWEILAAVEAEVDCSGETHRLRWEAGELGALDHDRPASERTLAALAGKRCACVEHLDTWARHQDDLAVLVLASRGPADQIHTGPATAGTHAHFPLRATARLIAARGHNTTIGWGSNAPLSRIQPQTEQNSDPLVDLLRVHPGLSARLAAGVIASWTGRLRAGEQPEPAERAMLQAALYGRVLASLRAWLGRPDLEAEVTMLGEGAGGTACWCTGRAEVGVPFGWLLDVWVPGLATLWGRFCLSSSPADGRVVLRTVGPDLAEPADLALDRPPHQPFRAAPAAPTPRRVRGGRGTR